MNDTTVNFRPETVDKRCDACAFSHEQLQPNGANILFCRRNPPTCVPVIQLEAPSVRFPNGREVQVMRSLWPAMAPQDWCHRFEARTVLAS